MARLASEWVVGQAGQIVPCCICGVDVIATSLIWLHLVACDDCLMDLDPPLTPQQQAAEIAADRAADPDFENLIDLRRRAGWF